jgi:tRNA G10  N-methylase Trm11
VNLFYATFIPGLQNNIAEIIKERLSDVKIHKLLDGSCLFETETAYDKLNFLCFNNIFAVINIAEYTDNPQTKAALEKHIKTVIKNFSPDEVICKNSKNIHTFRIVVSDENVPSAIDERLRTEIEEYISRLSGLKVNRSRPDTEFWFLYRGEKDQNDFSIFMKRLTLRSSWEKTLHKGELPPPLAWMMCRLAGPVYSDIVLDPFCGYGSIPDCALKHFHINKFIACDNSREAAQYTKNRLKKQKKENFIFYDTDFFDIPAAGKSINAIITDPPWGQYSEIKSDFYKKMFDVFEKLLKEGGRAVLLLGNTDIDNTIPASFEIKSKIPILLSGKKAVILVLVRSGKIDV